MTDDGDGFVLEFKSPSGTSYDVVIDDNNRVAYAYLRKKNRIVADVWLYNRCATPAEPEWKSRDRVPFANCMPYVRETAFELPASPSDFSVDWQHQDDGTLRARIFILGMLHATLSEGEKPGYCCLAARDGPLAKVLNSE